MKAPEIIIPGAVFVIRNFISEPDLIGCKLLDEMTDSWEVLRWRGIPRWGRAHTRFGHPGVTSTLAGKKQRVRLLEAGSTLDRLATGLSHLLSPIDRRPFNFVYANLYFDGSCGLREHWDGPFTELDPRNATIASLSFGETRSMVMRHRATGATREIPLVSGDLAVMHGPCQLMYLHSIPKDVKKTGPRLSLTYRYHRIIK